MKSGKTTFWSRGNIIYSTFLKFCDNKFITIKSLEGNHKIMFSKDILEKNDPDGIHAVYDR